ncbi:MAG TPA: methylated-DNA--[protein]-cysteine S-methyltransferase [Puia sp.]|nr:methylated-DNA--[protein]-cysteine S-methyltransferase [Puia sp.]
MNKEFIINYYRVEKAIAFLTANFRSQPSLERIAEEVNLSPFHFHRIFLDWVGITPKKFLQFLSVQYLRGRIGETRNVIEAADLAGFSSQSRVYDLFVNIEGVSPQQYKSGGRGLTIHYGYHPTPFGMAFIAVAEKGICDLHFVSDDDNRDEFSNFSKKWNCAMLVHQPEYTRTFIQRIFQPGRAEKLDVLLQGTPFQLKVWEALVNIPFGTVKSYGEVGMNLGCRNIRAVATAAGRNPILYLIPCHRIICKDGSVGEFHHGKVRKQTMIAWEMAKLATPDQ